MNSVIFLILYFGYTQCSDYARVFSPQNNSIVGPITFLRLEIPYFTARRIVNPLATAKNVVVGLLINRKEFLRSRHVGVVFECVVEDDAFKIGVNSIVVEFIAQTSSALGDEILYSIDLYVHKHPAFDDYFYKLIHLVRSPSSYRLHHSYLLVDLNFHKTNNNTIWTRLSALAPGRLEVLSLSALFARNQFHRHIHTLDDIINMPKVAHNILSEMMIVNIAVVDYTFIFIGDIATDASSLERMELMILSSMSLTRKLVVLVAPNVLNKKLLFSPQIMNMLETRDISNRLSDRFSFLPETLPGYSTHVLSSNAYIEYKSASIYKPGAKSSIEFENYEPGRSFILLNHVCLSENDNMIVLFNSDIGRPVINESYLAENEDRGFLYSGLRFLEVPPAGPDATYISQAWPRFPGMSALSVGVSPGHIIHESEPLTQLYYAATMAMEGDEVTGGDSCVCGEGSGVDEPIETATGRAMDCSSSEDNRTRCSKEKQSWNKSQKYSYIFDHLDRLILGTVSTATANDWLLSYVGSIAGVWRAAHLRREAKALKRRECCSECNLALSSDGSEPTDLTHDESGRLQDSEHRESGRLHEPEHRESGRLHEPEHRESNRQQDSNRLEVFLKDHLFPLPGVPGVLDDPPVHGHHLRESTSSTDRWRSRSAPSNDDSNQQPEEIPRGICFDQLLLLGRANSHVGYFGSDNLSEAFKRLSYDRFGIQYDYQFRGKRFSSRSNPCSSNASTGSISSSSGLGQSIELCRNPNRGHVHESADSGSSESATACFRKGSDSFRAPGEESGRGRAERVDVEEAFPASPLMEALRDAHDPDACSSLPAPEAPRSRKLRVTFVLRSGSERSILNMNDVLETLLGTGLIDEDWLTLHTRSFDLLTYAEQILLMSKTDVLIAVHGAAVINGIFMRRGSAVIDVLNGPYFEYFFSPLLREAGVHPTYVPALNFPSQFECPVHVPAHCLQGYVDEGASLTCVGLRRCSVRVDLQLLRVALMDAYSHVLTKKWMRTQD